LAVVVAFSIYGGFPEANVMFALAALAVVLGAGIVAIATRWRQVGVGVVRAVAGLGLGGALSAPLWLPGLQVISISHRESEGSYVGLPTRAMALLFSQGYYGLPTGPHPVFQLPQFKYYEAVTYVGVIAVVLAVVAIGTSIRRPVVAGLTLALVISLALTYQPVAFHPLQSIVNALPYLRSVSSNCSLLHVPELPGHRCSSVRSPPRSSLRTSTWTPHPRWRFDMSASARWSGRRSPQQPSWC
jgi:hypothetical protein